MKAYTESDIQVLTDREHVRLRLPVYAGRTSTCEYDIPIFTDNTFRIETVSFIPAVYCCVREIIDNGIDELTQLNNNSKQLTITADPTLGTYKITDNGRGVPIGKHETGKYTPELVFGSLRSGRNFTQDKTAGVIGVNGMGASITNFCSTKFIIDVCRDNKHYVQEFSDGGAQVTPPDIKRSTKKHTGTTVEFQLDPTVFEGNVTLPAVLMENKALELALTNPGITITYNGIKHTYKTGFNDIIKKMSTEFFRFETENMEFFVIFDIHTGVDEKIFSWVNNSLLFDGGIVNTQFLNAFYDRVVSHLAPAAKKHKCEVTKNDIRENLLVLGNLKLKCPEYDAQSKTRLTGPNLKRELVSLIDENWTSFSKKHKDWLTKVLDAALVRHNEQANKRAIKEQQRKSKKKIPGLVDATSTDRGLCQLLITEGDSAAAQITQARNPITTASLPLRGKINNVYGTSVAQVLKMGKVTDLLAAIGLIPGRSASFQPLNYGKIIIATDADHDGADIFTLLINLFYTYWPELFNPNDPKIYRLTAPNVVAVKGKQRTHFTTRALFEENKKKYQSWAINYYKGLGSMHKEDWHEVLNNPKYILPIVDDGQMAQTLTLLFGTDTNARKHWLQH